MLKRGEYRNVAVWLSDVAVFHWPALYRHLLWMRLGEHTWGLPLFRLYGRLTGGDLGVVAEDTDLVVEGYPRSANTFVVAALRLASGGSLRLAHHVHGPVQFQAAEKWGVPCILLLRHPADSVPSLCIRYPYLPLSLALRNYTRFHRSIRTRSDRLLVVPFEQATEHLGTLLDRLRDAFRLRLPRVKLDDSFVRRVFQMVEEMDYHDRGTVGVGTRSVARPSEGRQQLINQLKEVLSQEQLAPLVSEAAAEYDRLLDTQPRSR